MTQHDQFVSPFSWRYGSPEMRRIWSEVYKRQLWRRLWVALARAQTEAGLVTSAQADDLEIHQSQIDMARAEAIEAQIHHDLMAEVQTFAEQCAIGGGIIHLGATSADIEDNADALRLRESLARIEQGLRTVLTLFAGRIRELAHIPTMAFTHLQPAEPTTMGYRLALYAQDLLADAESIRTVRLSIRGKGFKGAVGTGASYSDLLAGTGMTRAQLETRIMSAFDLPAYPISSQTYPRAQDWRVLSALAGVAGSLAKFAFDLRLLQSPLSGEWREPFADKQVGSSAMPFKRNPIHAEKMSSLARLVAALVPVAWENAAYSLLERTLDDSANRRETLPVAFLAVDEMLIVARRLLDGLVIDHDASSRTLARFGVFAASERVLMATARAGADRQQAHEHLRAASMTAWAQVNIGAPNPLTDLLANSAYLQFYLPADQIRALLVADDYMGDAPERALAFANNIDTFLSPTQ